MGGVETSVTALLRKWTAGDATALDQLMPLVYDHLRGLAHRYLASERQGHTLQSTALVHEAFLKLISGNVSPKDRGHFLALAARAMRQILVDHARSKHRDKRGGGAVHLTLNEAVMVSGEPPAELLDLDDALNRLAARDERKAKIVELIHFGGLNYEETCLVLGISPSTLHREFSLAKAWLVRELKGASRPR
jgi:RNA polymerase sigma factor (TIGR02999 family)